MKKKKTKTNLNQRHKLELAINFTLFIWIYCDWKVPSPDKEKQLFYNVFSLLIQKLYECSLFITNTLFSFPYIAVKKIVFNTCLAGLEKLLTFPPMHKKNQLMSRASDVCLYKFSTTSNAYMKMCFIFLSPIAVNSDILRF